MTNEEVTSPADKKAHRAKIFGLRRNYVKIMQAKRAKEKQAAE